MLLLALLSPASWAWDSTGATWPDEAMPIPYQVQEDLGFSAGGQEFSDEEVLAAVQAGFAVWEEVDCASVRFAYQGRVDDASFGQQDSRNVVFLIDQAWPEDPGLVSAPTIFQAGTELVEVDIALNLDGYAWTLDNADGVTTLDVQAGIVHEVGHLLGLWHSDVAGASLNPSMAGHPEAVSLEDDDIEGLCTLYGGSGEGGGTAEVGEDCVTADDCLEGLDCLVDGGERYCTEACSTDEDCPADMVCAELGGGTAVCARDAGARGCGCGGGGVAGSGLALVGLLGLLRRRRSM